jgi:YrhK-like protein
VTARHPYVDLPPGAHVLTTEGPGPFVTRVLYELEDGTRAEWTSRRHRKRRTSINWWCAALFIVGSFLFALGSLAGYSSLVGEHADAVTYFVGSIFFTAASYLQYIQCISASPTAGDPHPKYRWWAIQPQRVDWWATIIQLLGTIFFNFTTFDALIHGLDPHQQNLVVWSPDVLGSICFLVSSQLAYAEVGHRWISWHPADQGWRIAAINLLGSILFGISAIAGYVVPATGDLLDAALDSSGTFFGAVCFLIGAVWMMSEGSESG